MSGYVKFTFSSSWSCCVWKFYIGSCSKSRSICLGASGRMIEWHVSIPIIITVEHKGKWIFTSTNIFLTKSYMKISVYDERCFERFRTASIHSVNQLIHCSYGIGVISNKWWDTLFPFQISLLDIGLVILTDARLTSTWTYYILISAVTHWGRVTRW